MTTRLYAIAVLSACLIVAVVLHFVKKNRFSEEYSSIWLGVSALILFTAIFSKEFIVAYGWIKGDAGSGPEILLFAALVFVVFFLILVSIRLSDYYRSIVRLSQEVGILRNQIEQLKNKSSI